MRPFSLAISSALAPLAWAVPWTSTMASDRPADDVHHGRDRFDDAENREGYDRYVVDGMAGHWNIRRGYLAARSRLLNSMNSQRRQRNSRGEEPLRSYWRPQCRTPWQRRSPWQPAIHLRRTSGRGTPAAKSKQRDVPRVWNRAQTIAATMIFPNGNTIEKTITTRPRRYCSSISNCQAASRWKTGLRR